MSKTKRIQKKEEKQQSASKGSEKIIEEEAVPAVVKAIIGRTGVRGELTQVQCRILRGRNMGKQIRRNVRGPVKPRDILMLRETEIEARKLMKKISKGAFS